ncbi:hypothetical protein HHK36_018528 [Tetracentron sinense]|uniref:Uncharacterized protein n=1 Tax=Tetracentron sinense TaxID=13715 RepID=A0A834Z2D8_TETSI|nr:hypothetical protein HHK36_018528 [Tetracentron sinense]
MASIDDAAERIVRVKFIAGLFEHPFTDRSLLDTVGCKVHRELAREAVPKSLVLFKKWERSKETITSSRRILVAGRHADDLGYQCGGWTITTYGTSGTRILDAIKEDVGEKTQLIYDKNPSRATFEGQDFLFTSVVVGEPTYAESRGYDTKLNIPFDGIDIINLVGIEFPH